MKQKKFGQKIQNWHRPLGQKELRESFRRYRQGQKPYERIDAYEGWYYDCDEDWAWEVDENDLKHLRRTQLIQDILAPYPLQITKAFIEQYTIKCADFEKGEQADRSLNFIAFAQELDSFIWRIQDYDGNDLKLVERVRAAMGGCINAHIVATYAPDCAGTYCLFAPFWIREPVTWNPDLGVSLESHLFARYPIPSFLSLKGEGGYTEDKWVCWLILLGRGVSLKVAAEIFDWEIPARLPAFLSHVPANMPPIRGTHYAEILRLGGTADDCKRILAEPLFALSLDITDPSQDIVDIDFWRETVSWLIRYSDQISDLDCEMILAWGRHLYTEAHAGRRGPFHWKGRSVQTVLEQSRAYRLQCEQNQWCRFGNYSWASHGWDWQPEEEALEGWSFTELTTTSQLVKEGQVMHHCVGGYGRYCANNISAIVSVRFLNECRVTIEIRPSTGQIVQIRGAHNRNADQIERKVTALWHNRIVMPTIV